MNCVVIVEGASDKAAVEALARFRGLDLVTEGVLVEPIGGAHAVGAYLRRFGNGSRPRLAGLVDLAEAPAFARALELVGVGAAPDVAALERLGFFVCSADLEAELIRAVGPAAVEAVIEEQGELRSFRSFQKQPAHRVESIDAQLHRFLGTHAGRKAAYARALIEAGVPDRVPPPLRRLLEHITGTDN